MKILVFSDSHGDSASLRRALAQHRGTADAVVFLGDGAADMASAILDAPEAARCILAGNCDSRYALAAAGIDAQSEAVLNFGGLRFLALHGHTRRVKYGYESLLMRASEVQADAVLFGHTHIPENEFVPDPMFPERRILLFNPGSIGMTLTHPYGVINVVNGEISADHGHAEEHPRR